MTPYSHLPFLVATLLSLSSFANKELWDNAHDGEWKLFRTSLKASKTPEQDLQWVHEEKGTLVRDMLIDARRAIKRSNSELYETLFAENGLIGWHKTEENTVIDSFIAAARIREIFEFRNSIYQQHSLSEYRNILANAFSPEELAELASIYQDPDFKLLVELCEQAPNDVDVSPDFKLELSRILSLDPLVSVLKVILIEDDFDTTVLNEVNSYLAIYPLSEMLFDFSNERIISLTKKLGSSVYRRELFMRGRFL